MQLTTHYDKNATAKPYSLEARAFYLGAHGIDPAHELKEIEERFTQETSAEKQESLRALRDLEGKLERVRQERPEAESVWNRTRKELGDTPPPFFHAVLTASCAVLALVIDTLFLAPTMDMLNITNPVLQFIAAAGVAALSTAWFERVGVLYLKAGSSTPKRIRAITEGSILVVFLIGWGILRGYELRFAAGLAGNPLGDFLGQHPILASLFYIFITLATPIIGATEFLRAWTEVSHARTWRTVRERFETLRAAEVNLGCKVQSATETLDHFDRRKEAACREWQAIFAQFYERGQRHGARKEPLLSIVAKSALGGAGAIPFAFLIPGAFVPALIAFPVVAGFALFTFLNHRRHHPSHERYLAQENTHFAVIPDAPKLREASIPAPRLLSKGDQQ